MMSFRVKCWRGRNVFKLSLAARAGLPKRFAMDNTNSGYMNKV